jgi:microcystin degradation protein MlrC
MRIIVGGMNHESNTLNPIITGEDDFVVFRGKEMLEEGMKPYYSSTGIIEAAKGYGWDIVPTVLARAVPNGVVSGPLYRSLKAEFLAKVREAKAAGKVDGACLALHGSMKVEGLGSAEGDLLAAFREILPDVPLTVALDMHATMTADMFRYCDAFVGYKTAPHVDCKETGAHAARLLKLALDTGRKLTMGYRKVPMLIAGEKSETAAEPMRSLIDECIAAEKRPGILAASFLLGFPWADCADGAVTAVTVTMEDKKTADALAVELADSFWARRKDFIFRSEYYDSKTSVKKAIDAVLTKGLKPVFLSDSGDNPTAGAAGDATDLFERVLEALPSVDTLPTPLLYSGFFAAEATEACLAAGIGKTVDVTIGGRWDTINGRKIPLAVKVLNTLADFGPYHAKVAFVQHRDLRIVLTSKHIGFGDEELLPALGVNAADYCLVVVKLGYLEECFRSIAALAIMATSKGCSNEVLETIPYTQVRRPIYPLDPDMSYRAK